MKNKKSLFGYWLLSYLLILLIPLFFSGLMYSNAYQIVKEQTSNSNQQLLKQLQTSIDNIIQDAQKIVYDLALDDRIKFFTYPNNEIDKWSYSTIEFYKDSCRFNLSNSYFSNYYIYFNKNDYVLSPSGSGSSELMYSVLGYDQKMSYEEWMDMLQNTYQDKTLTIENTLNNPSILYLQSIPLYLHQDNQGTIALVINSERFQSLYEIVDEFNQSGIYIYDSSNNQIASSNSDISIPIIDFSSFDQSEGILQKSDGSNQYMINYLISDFSGLKFISITPNSIYFKYNKNLQQWMLLCLLLTTIIGGIVAYVMTRSNYKPVKQIVNTLYPSTSNREINEPGNEYHLILKGIENKLNEANVLSEKLKFQSENIHIGTLFQLLTKSEPEKICDETLLFIKDCFPWDNYCVIIFNIKQYGKFIENDQINNNRNIAAAKYAIYNVLEELLQGIGTLQCVEISEKIIYIVSLSKNDSNTQTSVNDYIETLRMLFQNEYDMTMYAAISSIHTSYNGISVAYQEACEALEYSMLISSTCTVFFKDIQVSEEDYFFPIEMEIKLINHIKTCNYAEAEKLIDFIFESNNRSQKLSLHIKKCLIYELIGGILKGISEISKNVTDCPIDRNRIITSILQGAKYGNDHQVILQTVRDICSKLKYVYPNTYTKLCEEIKQFLQNNYSDANLCLNSVADIFQMTPSYLSKIFKENIGKSLPDYLSTIRIDEAKRLLQETNLSVSEISEKVGLSGSNALIRIFKKYEGITPGQYREICIK